MHKQQIQDLMIHDKVIISCLFTINKYHRTAPWTINSIGTSNHMENNVPLNIKKNGQFQEKLFFFFGYKIDI